MNVESDLEHTQREVLLFSQQIECNWATSPTPPAVAASWNEGAGSDSAPRTGKRKLAREPMFDTEASVNDSEQHECSESQQLPTLSYSAGVDQYLRGDAAETMGSLGGMSMGMSMGMGIGATLEPPASPSPSPSTNTDADADADTNPNLNPNIDVTPGAVSPSHKRLRCRGQGTLLPSRRAAATATATAGACHADSQAPTQALFPSPSPAKSPGRRTMTPRKGAMETRPGTSPLSTAGGSMTPTQVQTQTQTQTPAKARPGTLAESPVHTPGTGQKPVAAAAAGSAGVVAGVPTPHRRFTLLSACQVPGRCVTVLGVVVQLEPASRVRTRSGRFCDVASVLLSDTTRKYFKVTLWGRHADLASRWSLGSVLLITDVKLALYQGKATGSVQRASTIRHFHLDAQAAGPGFQHVAADVDALFSWSKQQHVWMYKGQRGHRGHGVCHRTFAELATLEDRVVHFRASVVSDVMTDTANGSHRLKHSTVTVGDAPQHPITLFMWGRQMEWAHALKKGTYWDLQNVHVRQCPRTSNLQLHTISFSQAVEIPYGSAEGHSLMCQFGLLKPGFHNVAHLQQVTSSCTVKMKVRVSGLVVHARGRSITLGQADRDGCTGAGTLLRRRWQQQGHGHGHGHGQPHNPADFSFLGCVHCKKELTYMPDGKTPNICSAVECSAALGRASTMTETCTPHMSAAIVDVGVALGEVGGATLSVQLGGGGGLARDGKRVGSVLARQFLSAALAHGHAQQRAQQPAGRALTQNGEGVAAPAAQPARLGGSAAEEMAAVVQAFSVLTAQGAPCMECIVVRACFAMQPIACRPNASNMQHLLATPRPALVGG